jgi:hypothetical protein
LRPRVPKRTIGVREVVSRRLGLVRERTEFGLDQSDLSWNRC